ncbi:MAG: hypothetical protein ACJ75J_17740, partial [Cytophagaceae bacterium]
MLFKEKASTLITHSNYISRDLSWMKFNYRVLDQAKNPGRNIFEKLKFLAIASSNLDEFFQIRIGSLYNYIDYGKERVDYSGLREKPFRIKLLQEVQKFFKDQYQLFTEELAPQFEQNGFMITPVSALSEEEKVKAEIRKPEGKSSRHRHAADER